MKWKEDDQEGLPSREMSIYSAPARRGGEVGKVPEFEISADFLESVKTEGKYALLLILYMEGERLAETERLDLVGSLTDDQLSAMVAEMLPELIENADAEFSRMTQAWYAFSQEAVALWKWRQAK